jgi:branched-chain amino acid transport system permease protein/neutral amino acid transport system permease protein
MAQLLVNGIVLGGIIVLGAIGLSLIYGILKFANFSHGDMMALGAYLAFFFKFALGMPLFPAAALAVAATAAVGLLIDKILYHPLRRTESPVILLISSVGVALILRNLIRLFWGPQIRYYDREIQIALTLPGGVKIKPDQIMILVVTAALVTGVHLFLTGTRTGKALRAASDNMELARVSGIDINRVVLWTWLLGVSLAAVGGVLLGMDVQLRPVMGWNLLLPIFAATILGGIGSPYGAMMGGMVMGIAQELSTAFLSTEYKPAFAFLIMLVVLLFRPSGILGVSSRWT